MKSSGNFFNEFSRKFDTFYDGKRNFVMQWIDRQFRSDIFIRFDLTFEFLGDLTNKTLLDIGCGSGPYITEALRRGARKVIGIDPARGMLDLAGEKVRSLGMSDRVILLEGYFPEVQPAENFDFGIVIGVMDYVENSAEFLGKLKQCVSQKLVISFPSLHWCRTPLRQVRYKIRRCPVYFYNPGRIQRLMHESGMPDYRLIKIPGAGMDYLVCLSL